MSLHITLIALSLIIMGSFLYSYLFEKWFITPVLLLIATGMVIKVILQKIGWVTHSPPNLLGVLGTVGLIVIVLEAVFDLEVVKENRKIMLISFVSSLLTVIGTALVLAFLFGLILKISWYQGLIYAIPLSIVSSAIIIPSIARLTGAMHQFMVLESIFSDIVGIVLFDYILTFKHPLYSSLVFASSIVCMTVIALLISIPLVYLVSKNNHANKCVFVLAALVFIYALAKSYDLPALIVIVMFGLVLNNMGAILTWFKLRHLIDHTIFHQELNRLRALTSEGSFLVRSLFFVFFGMSIDINLMLHWHVLIVGLLVLVVVYGIRWVVLTLFLRRNVILETTVAPRGLITILLYSQIQDMTVNSDFKPGHVLFIIILSCITMSAGLFWYGRKSKV